MQNKKLPDIKDNFSQWYNDLVYESELADQAPVKGCNGHFSSLISKFCKNV